VDTDIDQSATDNWIAIAIAARANPDTVFRCGERPFVVATEVDTVPSVII
jgi:hypothetical protein